MDNTEGIVITISAGMLKDNGPRVWLRNFLDAMSKHEHGWTYWMRVGARPKRDSQLLYVYICIGGHVRYRCFYAGARPGEERKRFHDGAGGIKEISAKAWVLLSGPIERPPKRMKFPMKGFRGYRYTEKIF